MQHQSRSRPAAAQHSYQRSGDSTRSDASSNLFSPNHIRTPSSEQFPNGVPLISRDPTGYFNMSNLQNRSLSPATTPRTSADQPNTPASIRSAKEPTKLGGSFRRGSISSMFKPSHGRADSGASISKRRDSNATTDTSKTESSFSRIMRGRSFSHNKDTGSLASPFHQRASSRRGSVKNAVRRASNDIKQGVQIVKMGPSERDKFLEREKDKVLRELEELRRQNPALRPQYQRDYMAERQRQSYESSASRAVPKDGKLSAADQLNALERAIKMQEDQIAAQRDANLAREKATEEMEDCHRCGKPMVTALKDGLCERCHKKRLNGDFEDWFNDDDNDEDSDSSWSVSSHNSYMSRRSIASDSSTHSSPRPPRTRNVNEEKYMKIASNRRIRRVRQTVYTDPGNPFSDENDNDDNNNNTNESHLNPQQDSYPQSPPPTPRDSPAFRYNLSPAQTSTSSRSLLTSSSHSHERFIFGSPSMDDEHTTPFFLPHELNTLKNLNGSGSRPLPAVAAAAGFVTPDTNIRDSSFGPPVSGMPIASPMPKRVGTPELIRTQYSVRPDEARDGDGWSRSGSARSSDIHITLDFLPGEQEGGPFFEALRGDREEREEGDEMAWKRKASVASEQVTLAEALGMAWEGFEVRGARGNFRMPLGLNPPTPPPPTPPPKDKDVLVDDDSAELVTLSPSVYSPAQKSPARAMAMAMAKEDLHPPHPHPGQDNDATEQEEQEEEEYVAPRTYWRRSLPSVTKGLNLLADVPTAPPCSSEAEGVVGKRRVSRDDIEVRNTKYYGFYDGVLGEYSRQSRFLERR